MPPLSTSLVSIFNRPIKNHQSTCTHLGYDCESVQFSDLSHIGAGQTRACVGDFESAGRSLRLRQQQEDGASGSVSVCGCEFLASLNQFSIQPIYDLPPVEDIYAHPRLSKRVCMAFSLCHMKEQFPTTTQMLLSNSSEMQVI